LSDKNIEMMKKRIEEKKKKSAQQGALPKSDKKIGGARKAHVNTKKGGFFD
jgi:hypothetical protein